MTTTPLLPPSTRSPGQERHGATSTSADGGFGTCRSGHSSPAQCRTRLTCCREWSPRAIFEQLTPCARSTAPLGRCSTSPGCSSGSAATPPTRARHHVAHRPRCRVYRTSKPSMAAGIQWVGLAHSAMRSCALLARLGVDIQPSSDVERINEDGTSVTGFDSSMVPCSLLTS